MLRFSIQIANVRFGFLLEVYYKEKNFKITSVEILSYISTI